jgi:hypothetical protein
MPLTSICSHFADHSGGRRLPQEKTHSRETVGFYFGGGSGI